jgi:hypothetical protein
LQEQTLKNYILLSFSLPAKNANIKIYKTITLPVVLYKCKTSSLTLTEECRLRVFKNMVLRRIFEPKRDEVTGKWGKLHDKDFYALYSSPNTIRMIKSRRLKLAGYVARMGKSIGAYRVSAEKPEGRRPHLEDPGVDGSIILKRIFKKCEREGGMDWIDVAQDRGKWRALVDAVRNVLVP